MTKTIITVILTSLLLISMVIPSSGQQQPQQKNQDDAREEEMFGSGQDDNTAAQPENADFLPDDDPFAKVDSGFIDNQLQQAENTLDLGARLYLQWVYDIREKGDPLKHTFKSPNLLDLYVDGRPNPRLRVFISARLMYDYTARGKEKEDSQPKVGLPAQEIKVTLDQIWLKLDLARTLFITLGRQPLKWGTGYFWNPSDFVNSQRRDPLAFFDQRLGVDMVKLHLPLETLGWNFYAILLLDGSDTPEKMGGALRMEMLLGQMEWALSMATRKNQPFKIGSDLSFGLHWFDFRFEGSLTHNETKTFFRGQYDPFQGIFPEKYHRDQEWIGQILAGVEASIPFGDEDSLIVGLEYFFNQAGYSQYQLYPYLFLQGVLTPLHIGREYAGIYFLLMAPGRWDDTTFILSGLGNLSDSSYMTRFDYRVKLLTHLQLTAYLNYYFGRPGGELRYGITIPPNQLVTQGLTIVPPLYEVGLGMTVKF